MIFPDWPVSSRVKSCVTTRQGGISLPPYNSLNLAAHVGDDPFAVAQNRQGLRDRLHLPSEPIWLSQVHGCDIYDADQHEARLQEDEAMVAPIADASISHQEQRVLSVLTADCLPILVTNRAESMIMAIHAGWRGLADGIVIKAVEASGVDPAELLVWIGPGIGGRAFEIGEDVRQAFLTQQAATEASFLCLGTNEEGLTKYRADTAQIAKAQLHQLGVGWVGGGHWCTYSDQEQFFSYRREEKTGRMASLIWLSGDY